MNLRLCTITFALFNIFAPTPMYSWWDEYSNLLETQPTLDSETLIYYHTRMKVEYELVNIFNIPHPEGQVLLLTDIIQKAFRPAAGATQEQKDKARNNRVFFTSRKTLLLLSLPRRNWPSWKPRKLPLIRRPLKKLRRPRQRLC